MRVHLPKILCFVCLTVLLISGQAQTNPSTSTHLTPTQTAHITQRYVQLPLAFEANKSQVDPQVKFFSQGAGYNLFLTPTEAVLTLWKDSQPQPKSPTGKHMPPQNEESAVLRMKLLGANAKTEVFGQDQLQGTSNYFIGNDPKQWHTGVRQYAKVRYAGVYHGVDLVYYGNQQELEYDFVLQPGADPGLIRLGIEGASSLRLDHGDLVLQSIGGDIHLSRPHIYQDANGVRKKIGGGYVLKNKNEVGFMIASYDRRKQLVIDPVLAYSTYLGGSNNFFGQSIRGIAVDKIGNVYVTGSTDSPQFPVTNAFQPTIHGPSDAFVTKINADGTGLVYSTFLGGSSYESGVGIAVDSVGNAYVSGLTYSTDFPTVHAIQPNNAGNGDVFVTKINAKGDALIYSTYLGGSGFDEAGGIAVGSTGIAYVTGDTLSTDFPTANALQPNSGGGYDAFVTKINISGSALLYSTYLGGSGDDGGPGAIAADSTGNAYVTGMTTSTDFPIVNAIQPTNHGGYHDAFVTKINTSGSTLLYSTYLGGSGDDSAPGIAVDSSGNAYVAGGTTSTDFPVANALQATLHGLSDGYVTKINAAGNALVYSTYLGGSGSDGSSGIAVDSAGNAHVAGATFSTDFPTVNPIQTENRGGQTGTVFEINSAGNALVYSTYLGGTKSDSAEGLALDSVGNVYVTMFCTSTNLPITPAGFQHSWTGRNGSFVAKIAPQSFVSGTQPALGFGKHAVGTTSAPIKRTLTNHGTTTVTIRQIYIAGANPGDFAETNNCGTALAAGASCKISITFSPTVVGARKGVLVVSDSDPASPQAAALMGTGT